MSGEMWQQHPACSSPSPREEISDWFRLPVLAHGLCSLGVCRVHAGICSHFVFTKKDSEDLDAGSEFQFYEGSVAPWITCTTCCEFIRNSAVEKGHTFWRLGGLIDNRQVCAHAPPSRDKQEVAMGRGHCTSQVDNAI